MRPTSHRLRTPVRASLAAAALLALAACGRNDAPPPVPPPPEVGVVAVQPRRVPLASELPGRIEAVRTAQVRARVNGIVLKRLFVEGSQVKAGQPLFVIDPAPYRAAVESAQATLARAQANQVQAAALLTRYKPLREANAISQQDYTAAQAAAAQADADVAAGKAAVTSAQLNLGYASVTAPISGRIGRALVTEGALVTAAEATQLALIQQIDPVYANFTQPVADIVKLRRSVAAGKSKSLGQDVPVQITLDDGTALPQPARLLFSDLTVDPTSGQVVVRAEVPNADGTLLPGMYVRGRVAQTEVDAMLLPQQAVQRASGSDTVTVVGADGKPAMRPVKLGGVSGQDWIVLDGLKPGEQVIVDGFQKMRPGAAVRPVPWTPAGSAPAAASAASR
jgi:membrane fusion protein (multidrug efflux system)